MQIESFNGSIQRRGKCFLGDRTAHQQTIGEQKLRDVCPRPGDGMPSTHLAAVFHSDQDVEIKRRIHLTVKAARSALLFSNCRGNLAGHSHNPMHSFRPRVKKVKSTHEYKKSVGDVPASFNAGCRYLLLSPRTVLITCLRSYVKLCVGEGVSVRVRV